MIIPKKESHVLFQGATWDRLYKVVDDNSTIVPLTGCTAKMSLREAFDSDLVLIAVDGQVNEAPGTVYFEIPDEASEDAEWTTAVFDVELYWLDGRVDKLAYGTFKLQPEVTRV